MLRVVILIFNIILACLILYMGFELFNQLSSADIEEKPLAKAVPSRKATPILPKKLQRPHYSSISQRNLFATQATPSAPVQKINIENLKQTDLDLKLWGTVAGDSAKAYAVIEDLKKRKQNLYRTGDNIQNATVKMIVREKVVLTVNGKDEILEMEKLQQGGRSPRRSRSSGPASRKQASRRPPRTQKITLPKALVDDALKDLDKLGQQVKMQPHMENGNFNGLILTGIKPRSLLRRMGLRNGDVITRVGGEAVGEEATAPSIIQSLTASANTSAEIKRRGRIRTINYTIK